MAELNLFHYHYQNSLIHKMDGRIKLCCTILLSIAVSIAARLPQFIILTVFLLIALDSSKLPLKKIFNEIKYFLLLIASVIIVHAFSIPGTPLPCLPMISGEGIYSGLLFGWRLILIIIISTVLTGTTTLALLKNTIEWFLRPIPFVPHARIATMFGLTFVLTPLLFDQASLMLDAQKARCVEGRKNPIQRILFLVYPLLLQTFRRAEEMVSAMEARCYSEDRTQVTFKTTAHDWIIFIMTGLICALVLVNL